MNNAMAHHAPDNAMMPIGLDEMRETLRNSLYPGASNESIDMVLGYCKAAGLDVMLKPVHIVPMWSSKEGRMRDVVMPGIGMYRVQASRSGEWAGVTEPEFGPIVREKIGGVDVEYPEWCRVTTRRLMRNGAIAEFTAIEYWLENYAVKGGKEKSIAPNAMWSKRPRGQIAKCAQAQSLRLAFPEIGAAPTAEEMEGKSLDVDAPTAAHTSKRADVQAAIPADSDERRALIADMLAVADTGADAFRAAWKELAKSQRALVADQMDVFKARCEKADALLVDAEFEEVPA